MPAGPARLLPLLALVLTACGSNDRQPEPPPGSFDAEILNDGTKLFTYTLELQPARGERPSPALSDGGDGRPAQVRLPDPHRSLQQLLEQNGYCREGYVTLEQYRLGLRQQVRGECREAADARDRKRFDGGRDG